LPIVLQPGAKKAKCTGMRKNDIFFTCRPMGLFWVPPARLSSTKITPFFAIVQAFPGLAAFCPARPIYIIWRKNFYPPFFAEKKGANT
jgi:hypothetical protein